MQNNKKNSQEGKNIICSPPSVWRLYDFPLSRLRPPSLLLSAPPPLLTVPIGGSTYAVQLTAPIGDDGQRCPAPPAAGPSYGFVQMQYS